MQSPVVFTRTLHKSNVQILKAGTISSFRQLNLLLYPRYDADFVASPTGKMGHFRALPESFVLSEMSFTSPQQKRERPEAMLAGHLVAARIVVNPTNGMRIESLPENRTQPAE
jgi:hypothetical protein